MKSTGIKPKELVNLSVFLIGFHNEGGILFARVLATDEKLSLNIL